MSSGHMHPNHSSSIVIKSKSYFCSILMEDIVWVLMWFLLRSLGHTFGLLSGYFLYSCTLEFLRHSCYVEMLVCGVDGVTRCCCGCLLSHAHWVSSPFRMCLPVGWPVVKTVWAETTGLSPNGKLPFQNWARLLIIWSKLYLYFQ